MRRRKKKKENLGLAILTLIIGLVIAYYIDVIDPVVRDFIKNCINLYLMV